MQRRKDKVSREGGLDRDLGGLEITYFADEYNVGILTEK